MFSTKLEKQGKLSGAIILYMLATTCTLAFLNVNILIFLIFSWIVPSIFFIYKIKTFRKKILLNSIFWSFPTSLAIDYIGHYTNTWYYWDNPKFAIIGIEILEVPIESFFWGFAFWLFHITLYEFIFDKHRSHSSKTFEKYLLLLITAVSFVIVIFLYKGGDIRLEYFYLLITGIFTVYSAVLLFFHKHLALRMLVFGLLAFILGMIVEIVSLSLGFWTFPGNEYLWIFNLHGKILPIEEILWWIILPISIGMTYETFTDTGD